MTEQKRMIGVYVDDELHERLRIEAQKRGINSVSTYIRFSMIEKLNKKENEKTAI